MAITDALTGLHKPALHGKHLGTLARAGRDPRKPLALMMLDIDFFNRSTTIMARRGDDVLREFAVRCASRFRGIDLAALWRREFCHRVPETDLHVAGMVAERLRRSIRVNLRGQQRDKPHRGHDLDRAVDLELKGEPVADVLKRADIALYGQARGRNRVVRARALELMTLL